MKSTLPKNTIHYCPKCGSSEFSFKEDQSFLCDQCQFHLYINSAAAVAAIILNDKGEILFTKRAVEPHKGMLDLPGGFVDIMESAENALYREIKEELNLDIESFQYFMSSPNEYIFEGLSVFTLDLAYICKLNSFNHIHAKDDISAYEFIAPNLIPYNQIGGESIKKITKAFAKNLINEL
ncbi:NUDIX domain-containing protein [Ancylomarina euxinus]|uniref:NUDIX domain-containing protein n=1 Tax=Ancylomarina euxinus TaxID=2283627 RepID=A0A425Y1L5_9BACT|nr:NUDIX domain-containing protein [Ancylomarina euxinus]MCZ4695116.1 NUDIX domain-containing protein [Ancylomarina euxinus]MUP14948.1 NUDIX domain-containing protein [Ancylomarina euxinus]RRG21840.1 NUDIX domain-containing protein [Ancylomarina euxinus]